MPRSIRIAPGGLVFHVLNRRVEREPLFLTHADYVAFETVLAESIARTRIRLCAYCLMPNHWHLVVWPSEDGELSRFMHYSTTTHTSRWRAHRGSQGHGPLYQGRYKSFPVQSDEHYLTVVRYVERNALRAGLVERAEDWPFSSLWRRSRSQGQDDPLVCPGPIRLPGDWTERVNQPETPSELEALRVSAVRGEPYGTGPWKKATTHRLKLESCLRPRGRPIGARKKGV